MKGKGRKKAKRWILDNIVAIFALFFEILPRVESYFSGKEVNWTFFCIMIDLLLLFCIYKIFTFSHDIYKEYKKYKIDSGKLDDEVIKYGDTLQYNYAYCEKQIRETLWGNCLAIITKRCISFGFFIGVIVLICICNPQNANAYWNNVENIMGFTIDEDDTTDVESIIDDEKETEDIEENEQEVRNIKWHFILSEPTYSFSLETQMENQVFFDTDKSFTEWVDYVQKTVEQWKGEREGVNYKTIKDKDGNSFFTYTDMEDTFKGKVEDALQYIYYEEWQQNAPDSSEYDKCIAGREQLNQVEAEGKTGCYDIWWKLANDYQYYAQEYEAQTTNADAVLYYYTNSIYSCMEALKYSITEEEYNTTYHFMVMRYHDICRNECIISQEYKMKASNIYSILVEKDDKTLSGR